MAVVVLAPNAFKGTATAAEAAGAIADGWRSVRPRDELVLVPLADGGDGTLDAVAATVPGAMRRPVEVAGPVGGTRTAEWLLLPDGTALVELAAVGGLAVADREPLPPATRAARAATLGVGQTMAAALDAGCRRLLLAVGGSASTDGGAGLLQGLGARLLDDRGDEVSPGNLGLARVARADLTRLRPLPPSGAAVLTDVRNPLLGPGGAVAVFGEQKGVPRNEAPVFEERLTRFAHLIAEARAVDPAAPGTGAAGGTAFGALVWGAQLVDGAVEVARQVGLPAAIARADAVVTGEGRYDLQTAAGKAPSLVLSAAAIQRVPALLVVGTVGAPLDGWAEAVSLADVAGGVAAALADPIRWLRAAGALLAGRSSLR